MVISGLLVVAVFVAVLSSDSCAALFFRVLH